MDIAPPTLPRPESAAAPMVRQPVSLPSAPAAPVSSSEALAVKQAPLANLEVAENNTPSAPATPLPELSEEKPNTTTSPAQPKKTPPPGPRPPVAFIVLTVIFMVVLSGIAIALYMAPSSS